MLTWAQVAKGEDCKSYEYTPPAVRLRPSARKSKENGKKVAKGNKLCYISVTVTREVIKKIDISDDSYCSIAQLVE